MKYEVTQIPGVIFLTPNKFSDHRGFFAESYSRRAYIEAGIDAEFVQDNHSVSFEENTVRALHFQSPPAAQAKLVRCGRGAIFDVAVDIRRESRTYGKWIGKELSAKNGCQLFVPVGFAHGFVTLEPESEIVYKCSSYYSPENECSLRWDDPKIGIDWNLSGEPILSDKDLKGISLADLKSPF